MPRVSKPYATNHYLSSSLTKSEPTWLHFQQLKYKLRNVFLSCIFWPPQKRRKTANKKQHVTKISAHFIRVEASLCFPFFSTLTLTWFGTSQNVAFGTLRRLAAISVHSARVRVLFWLTWIPTLYSVANSQYIYISFFCHQTIRSLSNFQLSPCCGFYFVCCCCCCFKSSTHRDFLQWNYYFLRPCLELLRNGISTFTIV